MGDVMSEETVRREELDEGAIWKVSIAAPKANILDEPAINRFTQIFSEASESRDLKAVLIEGEGAHFSFGASVPEHLPGAVGRMLPRFHQMFRTMLESEVFYAAAVRGQCLGGGLELASFCHRVFASPDAKLGQPEIVLGVFAPIASVTFVERVGRSRAEDLCLSGRILGAEEALRIGLVDDVSEDPLAAALAYVREFLLPRSASSLRHAIRAVRAGMRPRFAEEIARVEKIYFEELMSTRDAVEGLEAFLEKRAPEWSNS
jgi:cyclohexa-1,5-dienecarbonyl-CoA hydratase